MAQILYGDNIAKEMISELRKRSRGQDLLLAIVILGDDYGSRQYLNSILRVAETLDIRISEFHFPNTITQLTLISEIRKLNNSPKITAILLQMPLPIHIDGRLVIQEIAEYKDVEGLHPYNLGNILANQRGITPCTPASVIKLLKYYHIDLAGRNVLVIGRSISVGKPLANLLINEDATVTCAHSKTINLQEISQRADIIIVAVGKANFLDYNYVQRQSVVIDVGINFLDGRLRGDANFNQLSNIVRAITPVPKGVGALTVAMLLENVIKLNQLRVK